MIRAYFTGVDYCVLHVDKGFGIWIHLNSTIFF